MSCLDHVLVSPTWEEHYPEVIQRLFPMSMFGHTPILLEAGRILRGK